MPHKRNPKLCADIIDLDGEIRANAVYALNASVHAHEADGRTEQVLANALEDAQIKMGDLLSRLLILISGLQVDPIRMSQNLNLTGGLLSTEGIMLALGKEMGRDKAHEVVQKASKMVTPEKDFSEVLTAMPEVGLHLSAAQLKTILDVKNHLADAPRIARETADRARDWVRQTS